MKRRNIIVTLVLPIFIFSLDALSETSSIKLGVTVPLTGDFTSYGNLIREGVELARKDLSKEGLAVEPIYEDACLPANAVSAINKLINIDKIDGLAANFCLIAMPPMAPILQKSNLIAFHTASASDSILNGGDLVFSTNIKVKDEARRLADYAFTALKARTASILYITTDFGLDYNKYFTERFEELGGKVVSSDTNPIGVNTFRSELMKVAALKPDVIFAAHLGPTLGILLKQAREQKMKTPFLSVYEAEDPSVIETAGTAAEDLRFFVPEPKNASSGVSAFVKSFENTYGHSPRILASNAYDATILLTRALAACDREISCAKNKLYSTRNHPGVSGSFTITSDGGAERELVLKAVKIGKFVSVSE